MGLNRTKQDGKIKAGIFRNGVLPLLLLLLWSGVEGVV
jgi:hypothetical protein